MAFKIKSERRSGWDLRDIVESAATEAEGLKNLYTTIGTAVENKKASLSSFSAKDLAIACGLVDERGSWQENASWVFSQFKDSEKAQPFDRIFSESNGNLNTDVFQTLLTDLIDSEMVTRMTDTSGLIGRELCTIQTGGNKRITKMAGLTRMGKVGHSVAEGHAYQETSFGEKWVQTNAEKYGRLLSVTMEAMMEDDFGAIVAQMNDISDILKLDVEETILRLITDVDNASGKYVYQPSGVGTQLYATGFKNLVASTALQDYTDLEAIWTHRATQVLDDRIDGTAQALRDLNMGEKVLLVPETLRPTAQRILNGQEVRVVTNTSNTTVSPNPLAGMVDKLLSSPILDGLSTSTWYFGVPKRQFVLRELLPIQTFTQGADSDAAFERDIVFRIKARTLFGVNAKDTPYFTKVTA